MYIYIYIYIFIYIYIYIYICTIYLCILSVFYAKKFLRPVHISVLWNRMVPTMVLGAV